ncbi:DUF421 domain-containing protein [Domibacillus sp. A3M-37]|uniref:DUF421 domain-containing protein n=1 Tax=Domibacillus sp. A3M-37 TaxID=2962037 RepID=UPI0020B67322|nr:YetF domain-containing protein [Domibacillus sp. A3M-37]MCP3763906.1 DUF421 domain-containing protein [Domibacillus sp. A3M-37]
MEIIEYIWTPLYVVALGYALTRLSGKKSVAQMHSYDLIFVITLGTAISEPIASKNNWLAGGYSLAIVIIYLLLSKLVLINFFKNTLTSTPTVLIRNGDIDEQGLKQIKMTVEELLGELRIKGFSNPSDIAIALMEETGKVSVIPKSSIRSLQPIDLQLSPKPAFVSIPIIIDGEVIIHNLNFIEKDEKWLYKQLQAYNISEGNIHTVTLATFNQEGALEIDNDHTHDYGKGIYNYKPGDEN